MAFKEIGAKEINDNLIKMIADEWMLICAGNEEKFNMMTASWGFTGEIWGKDYAVALVRPQRYTDEFMKSNENFALCFLGDNKKPHAVCGHSSGRDVDKTKLTGLKPVFSDGCVYFEQARLVIICKKTYVSKLDKECFLDPSIIEKNYPNGDFHNVYFGEIQKVLVNE